MEFRGIHASHFASTIQMERQKERRKKERKERKERREKELRDAVADIVFHGGNIYTIDDSNPKVEALAVKGERILAVGNLNDMKAKIKRRHTQYIDLKGKTLLPGLITAHEHATLTSASRFLYTNISAVGVNGEERDKETVLEIMRSEIAQTDPNEEPLPWCIFFGWDIELLQDLPTLNAKVLDEYSTKIPLMVVAQNGHAAWVNHKTFEVCEITSGDQSPPGGIYVTDENGDLTGLLLEEPAIKAVLSHAPVSGIDTVMEVIKSIQSQWREYSSAGFTTVTEIGYAPSPPIDLYLSATAAFKNCPIRLALYISTTSNVEPQIIENSKIWVAGSKIWADGSPHCGTAAVKDPFPDNELTQRLDFPPPPPPPPIPDPPKCGILNWSDEELFQMVKKLHDEGKQVSIHTNGDRAIDQVLNVYKQLVKPGDDSRYRIEHASVITEDQLKVCGDLGVLPSFFVYQLYYYGKVFSEFTLGEERTNRWCPMSTAIKYIGVDKISIHEDHPAFPGPQQPFANIKSAVTRTERHHPNVVYGKEFCITVEQAIKCLTIGAAYQLFKEDEIGSLEVGKLADLVILSADPFTIDPMKLDTDVKVLETYIGGHCNNLSKNKRFK